MNVRPLSLLVLLALACAPATPPPQTQPAPPPTPVFAPTGTAPRVVLLSFDGMGADALAGQTGLPSFAKLAGEGTTARIVPTNPTLTGPTHMSILTGTTAEKHGIVSNRFHLPGTAQKQTAMGMEVDPTAETLVEAARRQGKRVGCVVYPAMDGETPRRTCDFGLAWTLPLERARTIKLKRDDFKREWVPPTWTARPQRRESFSPIMRARIEWSLKDRAQQTVRADVDLVAYDTTNDRATNYDSFAVEVDERELGIEPSGWFSITRRAGDVLYGSWAKLVEADAALENVTVFWGGIHRNDAYPASYQAMIDNEVGFWPGEPDKDVSPEIFIEQSERLSGFLTRTQTLSMARLPWDLLLIYQPQIDEAYHQYLGVHDKAIRTAWVSADHALNAIRGALDPSRDALIVTGDHGLMPIDTELRVPRLLVEKGFAPRWGAFPSGAFVHLYRFEGADDSDALVNMLTGTGYFERVEKKSAASHAHAGEVFAYAHPNVALSSSEREPAVNRPNYHGQHGGLNTHRAYHTLFFATGPGIPRATFGELSQTKIARYVARVLGVQPPAGAE